MTHARHISRTETREVTWRIKIIDGPRIIDPDSGRGRVGLDRFDYFVVTTMRVQYRTSSGWTATVYNDSRTVQRAWGWLADEDLPTSFPAELRPFVRDFQREVTR